jgi:hypothetical protein
MEAQKDIIVEIQEGEKRESTEKMPLNLNKYAATGAMVSCAGAFIFIFFYLVGTTYGYMGYGDSLLSYIFGFNFGIGDASEVLLVVVTRFILVFSATWLPITALIARANRKMEN